MAKIGRTGAVASQQPETLAPWPVAGSPHPTPIPAAIASMRLPLLLLSLAGIALGALLIAVLAGGLVLLAELVRYGRDDVSDYLNQAQFDPRLKAQCGAAAISLLYAGLGAATLVAARLVGGRGWRYRLALAAVQLRWRRILGICCVTLAYAAALTLSLIRLQQRHAAAEGPTDVLLLATLVGNLVVLAPVAEELFFRGWLYTALRARFGFAPSFTLTTIAFAAIHWDSNHRRILLVMPLAAALGILREAAGSIKPTVVLHASYNALIVAITLLMS